MKTTLTKTAHGSIAILVYYFHYGEYNFPEIEGIRETQIYSGFDVDDILSKLQPKRTKKNYTQLDVELSYMRYKVFRGIIKDYQTGYYRANLAFKPNPEEYSNASIIMLEFPNEAQLKIYLTKLEDDVAEAITSASGDDAFFDYMPGFVDIFAQLCELLGEKKRYNNFIKSFIDHQTEDDSDCPYEFYRDQI